MNGANWQIEHSCPQCGAPVTLDETDRLLACPFCRTRLYIISDGPFRYHIPPVGGGEGTLLFLPYWRLRGSSFSFHVTEITHRFVDTNALAIHLPGMAASLGFRPQILKLRLTVPSTEGSFFTPALPIEQVIPDRKTPPLSVNHRVFIGEAASLIHAPFLLREDMLYDAVLDRPVCACGPDIRERLTKEPTASPGQIRFAATLCPHCGWDMEGEKDSLVLTCRNCDSAWACPEGEFRRVALVVLKPPAVDTELVLYLPFWRMKPRIEGLKLHSYADLIRLANLPKVITPAFEEAPLYFWSPAFKVNPALYSRWARQMTVFRPTGELEDRFPDTPLYPVTLPLHEAAEGIIVTLAQMITDKRRLYPQLASLRITLEDAHLEYHPFLRDRSELLHTTMKVTLDGTALSYGIKM